jgi:lipopolysaccharide export system protein LptA
MKSYEGPMKHLTVILATTSLCLVALALSPLAAHAQIAAGNGPTDVTADQLELVDAEHRAIWTGNVQVVQNGNRLVSDVLNIYYSGKAADAAAAKPAPAAKPGLANPASLGGWGDVQKLVAEGHVFYVSPDQTARGDHAVYEATPDTITLTGNVVVVQGQNVVKGDKLVIDVKTNHANMVSNVQGKNHPERVRGVFYNSANATAPSAPAPGAAAAPSKPAPKPAKP